MNKLMNKLMNKRNKLIIASALLIGAIGAGGIAFGEGRHHGGGSFGFGPGPERIERMAGKLDLSDEQRDAIRAIADKARPSFREYGDSLRDNREKLRELAQADDADQAAIRALADAQGDTMADMIVLRTDLMREVRAVLTPEQREELENKRSRHGRRHDGPRD